MHFILPMQFRGPTPGLGPRNCIGRKWVVLLPRNIYSDDFWSCISGSRFALMEIKAILYYLLLKFAFEPTGKTQIPIKLKKSGFTPTPEDGVHVELKPRKRNTKS